MRAVKQLKTWRKHFMLTFFMILWIDYVEAFQLGYHLFTKPSTADIDQMSRDFDEKAGRFGLKTNTLSTVRDDLPTFPNLVSLDVIAAPNPLSTTLYRCCAMCICFYIGVALGSKSPIFHQFVFASCHRGTLERDNIK